MQQPKHPLLRRGLDHLNNLPQIKAVYVVDEPYTSDRLIADGKLVLRSPQGEVEYIVEIKSNVTRQTLDSILQRLEFYKDASGERILLVGDRFSRSVVRQLLQKNIEFVDASGTIYLNNPFLYVLLQKDQTKSLNTSPINITQHHLKIIFSILQQPEILKNRQELAERTGFHSTSSVSVRLHELESLNYLGRLPNQKLGLRNYVSLLERWEIAYAETLRNRLLIDNFRPAGNQKISKVFENAIDLVTSKSLFDVTEKRVLIGGELGAGIATNYLKPTKATFHLPKETSPQQLALKLRLMPDPNGAITFLKQLTSHDAWQNPDYPYLADPLLIHAELSLETDERVKETAQRLYDQYLAERMA